jgi:hypothetical protein
LPPIRLSSPNAIQWSYASMYGPAHRPASQPSAAMPAWKPPNIAASTTSSRRSCPAMPRAAETAVASIASPNDRTTASHTL